MTGSHLSGAARVPLSICIPTHNFGAFIGAALESIVSQARPETEIIVLDSASTDDTRQVVESFQRRYENVHYVYADRKNGIDSRMGYRTGVVGPSRLAIGGINVVVRSSCSQPAKSIDRRSAVIPWTAGLFGLS